MTLETGVMKHDELLLPKGVCCLPYWMRSKKIEKKRGGGIGRFRQIPLLNHIPSFQSKRQISQLAMMVIFFFFFFHSIKKTSSIYFGWLTNVNFA